jgi:hypothetical protein
MHRLPSITEHCISSKFVALRWTVSKYGADALNLIQTTLKQLGRLILFLLEMIGRTQGMTTTHGPTFQSFGILVG